MAASLSEVVLNACEAGGSAATPCFTFAPEPAAAGRRRGWLSVERIEESISERRRTLAELQTTRDQERQALAEARAQLGAIEARIAGLEKSIAGRAQTASALASVLDRLMTVRGKAVARSARIAQHARERLERAAAEHTQRERHDQARPDGVHQRAAARTPVVAEVDIASDSNFYTGFTRNISAGGLFIATPDTHPIGSQLFLECRLPEFSRPIRCLAVVAWVREYHEGMSYERGAVAGMGVKFVGLTDDDATTIAAFQATRESLFFPDGSEGI